MVFARLVMSIVLVIGAVAWGEDLPAMPAGHPQISAPTTNPSTLPALPAGHPQVGQVPNLPAGHPMIGMGMAPATLPANGPISWKLPKGWSDQAAASPRYAIIRPPKDRPADLVVSNFPGDVGGTFRNINRWREQIGLQPIAEADLEKNIARLDVNGIKIVVADIASTNADSTAMLAAIVPDGDGTWFFKMAGAKGDVAKNKAEFMELIKSIKLKSKP